MKKFLEEFKAFIQDQESIFAKPNHGDCGRGIEKLKVADYADAEEMLNYIRQKKLSILEHCIRQHPQMGHDR